MPARLTFLAIAAFWVTMNVLLWRSEYGEQAGRMPVPAEVVWRKIITAPDASSLSVYQHGDRMGYCEFSTSIGQEMATVDGDNPPPDGLVKRAGYQIHLAGNVAVGDFTNRVKFDGRVRFNNLRAWRELTLKISSRAMTVEIHSLATNQTAQVRLAMEGAVMERNLAFADLQNPSALMRAFVGDFADTILEVFNLPDVTAVAGAQKMEWSSNRTRVKIGTQEVPVYRLETTVLGRTITVDVSTLGEILRVQLPGNLTAQIDEWTKP
jgi:hypothetical protein